MFSVIKLTVTGERSGKMETGCPDVPDTLIQTENGTRQTRAKHLSER